MSSLDAFLLCVFSGRGARPTVDAFGCGMGGTSRLKTGLPNQSGGSGLIGNLDAAQPATDSQRGTPPSWTSASTRLAIALKTILG
jgi:hypothetical protein